MSLAKIRIIIFSSNIVFSTYRICIKTTDLEKITALDKRGLSNFGLTMALGKVVKEF